MPVTAVPVLHVITRLDRGGSADNTLLTAARLSRERFAVSLATGPSPQAGGAAWEEVRGRGLPVLAVPHLVRPLRPLADVRALRELVALMRRGRYRLVHTHTSKAGFLGRLAAALLRVPAVVHTPHGHVFYGYHGRLLTALFVGAERWAAIHTDRLVALTPREVRDHLELGIGTAARFRVVHSGVDLEALAVDAGTGLRTRAELGLPASSVVVGTVGRLTAVKGQVDLVAAVAALGDPRIRLLLVGDGEERASLTARAAALGVRDQVCFAGWRADVPRLLAAMDIFVLPSYNEGMGRALVEAMGSGLAVIATAVGGVPAVVDSGVDGLLVRPRAPRELAAAIALLATDPAGRQRLGLQARVKAQHFSVAAMVRAIETMYVELIEEKQRAATAPI